MQVKDPRHITPEDVGQDAAPPSRSERGVGSFLGIGIVVWSAVVVLTLVFALVILLVAL